MFPFLKARDGLHQGPVAPDAPPRLFTWASLSPDLLRLKTATHPNLLPIDSHRNSHRPELVTRFLRRVLWLVILVFVVLVVFVLLMRRTRRRIEFKGEHLRLAAVLEIERDHERERRIHARIEFAAQK